MTKHVRLLIVVAPFSPAAPTLRYASGTRFPLRPGASGWVPSRTPNQRNGVSANPNSRLAKTNPNPLVMAGIAGVAPREQKCFP